MLVTFSPLAVYATARTDETLLDAARSAAVPLGNSCGGTGVCARCVVIVVEGEESLTPRTSIESRIAAQRGFAPAERLACQAVVRGDVTITAGYW
jgi:2Fe-2S ferredoxin